MKRTLTEPEITSYEQPELVAECCFTQAASPA